jgi:hypothetical protein
MYLKDCWLWLLIGILNACSSGGSSSAPVAASNTMVIKISPGTDVCNNINQPCVTMVVCSTNNPNQCINVPNILLDSGSIGLRIFASLLKEINLVPESTFLSSTLAQCVHYGDDSANWGPVSYATLKIGGETLSSIPLQLIDSNFPGNSNCPNASTSPQEFGINGVLGVAPINPSSGGTYYACNNGNCIPTAVSDTQAVFNPITALALDNNGIILSFPQIPSTGSSAVQGLMTLGIGTRANNQLAVNLSVYPIENSNLLASMITNFNQNNLYGFFDSGSNLLYFVESTIAVCNGYYCPNPGINLSALNSTLNGGAQKNTAFVVANAEELLTYGQTSYNNIAYSFPAFANYFDWGMPFFYGRTVYIAFPNKPTPLGNGPYWAY